MTAEEGGAMETKYYIVARIDGDHAWLKRTDGPMIRLLQLSFAPRQGSLSG